MITLLPAPAHLPSPSPELSRRTRSAGPAMPWPAYCRRDLRDGPR